MAFRWVWREAWLRSALRTIPAAALGPLPDVMAGTVRFAMHVFERVNEMSRSVPWLVHSLYVAMCYTCVPLPTHSKSYEISRGANQLGLAL